MQELDVESASVTAGDLAAFGDEVQRSVMYALPGNTPYLPWIGEDVLASSMPLVEGRRIQCLDAPVRRELLIRGPDGVSVLWPNGWYRSVHYSALAAALYYEDGAVRLIGNDATSATIEPTLWRNGARVSREIHKRVPEHLRLNLGSRPAGSIPGPTTSLWQRMLSVPWRPEPTIRMLHMPCHACGKAVREGSAFCHHCGAVSPYQSIRKGGLYVNGIFFVLGIQLVIAALILVYKTLLPRGGLAMEDSFTLAARAGFFGLGLLALRGSDRSRTALAFGYPLVGLLAFIWTVSSVATLGWSMMLALLVAVMDALAALSLYRSEGIAIFVRGRR